MPRPRGCGATPILPIRSSPICWNSTSARSNRRSPGHAGRRAGIGHSGPLPEPVADAMDEGGLAVCAVLSGNRNFEGRIHAQVRANYLAAPPLVVAYALAGTIRTDLTKDPLGEGDDGKPVYLRDIWPSNKEIAETVERSVSRDEFQRRYSNVFEGPPEWRQITGAGGLTYEFD